MKMSVLHSMATAVRWEPQVEVVSVTASAGRAHADHSAGDEPVDTAMADTVAV